MKAIVDYFVGVKEELAQVVWPKPSQVIKLTLIVAIISIVVGSYLGLLDLGFVKLLEIVIAR